jgi:hypothetical protein
MAQRSPWRPARPRTRSATATASGGLRAARALAERDASALTEAGLLDALPLAIARVPCQEGLCASARTA